MSHEPLQARILAPTPPSPWAGEVVPAHAFHSNEGQERGEYSMTQLRVSGKSCVETTSSRTRFDL